MNKEETLLEINKDREKVEAAFVFSLWKDPDLYGDYLQLNEGKDRTLTDSDAQFYFSLGKSMYQQGYRTFDNITLDTFLDGKETVKKKYNEFGGWNTVNQLLGLVNTNNVEAYLDKICKMNSLSLICKKYDEMFTDVKRFENASNNDVYNAIDLLNNSISLTTNHNTKVENLIVDEDFIRELNAGEDVGLNYGKFSPILNYTTLGAPLGDLYMFAGHSGCGKSSFIFYNMIIPFCEQGIECCIISNEMRSKTYKLLLLIYVLTHELNYWKMTRKKLKMGNFSADEIDLLRKAADITREKYSGIKFIKLESDNTSVVFKHIKKMAHSGCTSFVWDTMKSDDVMDESMWQSLLMNSRKLYHLVDNLNVSMVVTYQLALYTTNQRWLDAGCLSNGKQIKEVFSEMIYVRQLWADEYTGAKYDCKPWKFKKDSGGKIKETFDLNPDKKYMVCFVDKTRNDDDKKTILYCWDGQWNTWHEIGFCTIVNDHRGSN